MVLIELYHNVTSYLFCTFTLSPPFFPILNEKNIFISMLLILVPPETFLKKY